MSKTSITVIEGEVEINPYGDWGDVDKGLYVDLENIVNTLSEYEGQAIKLTIEVLK